MKLWQGLAMLAVAARVSLGATPEVSQAQAAEADANAHMEAFGLVDPRTPQPARDQARSVTGGGRAAEQFFQAKMSLPALDHAALIAADEANPDSTKRLRVGVSREVAIDAAKGQWNDIPGVGQVWTIALRAEGALGLRIRFADMRLPDGAYLQVWSPDTPDFVSGPFTGTGPLGKGYFWSTDFTGPRVYVEYIAPAGQRGGGAIPFTIDTVSHLYRDYLTQVDASRGAGSCHNDSSCFSEWSPLRNAVARIRYEDGGVSFVCTGQLLNSLADDLTPYLLTANHCIGAQADENPPRDPQEIAETVVAHWLFQTSTCNGSVPAIASKPRSDIADFLARTPLDPGLLDLNLGSDASLLMIRGELPLGLWWSGWTTIIPNPSIAATCIHHPAGTYKRISLGTRGAPFGKFWEIDWVDGPTEGGSSGSGIYRDDTQQLFGQLSHGISACGPQELTWDRFGKFSESFDVFEPFLVEGSDDDLEPNDDCAGAIDLPAGAYTDRVVKSLDEDWYRISVPSCADLNISVGFTNDFGNIDLHLFDACGGVQVAAGVGSGNGETISIESPGEPREYLLRVFLFTNTRNTYDLNVVMPSIAGRPAVSNHPATAGLPAPIPDSNVGGVIRTLAITEPGIILDLDVQLEIAHTWNGDLVVELSKDGTTVVLLDGVGSEIFGPPFGFNNDGFDIILDDSAPQSIETFDSGGVRVVGTFSPQPGNLSTFTGIDQSGTWQLAVFDLASPDTGSLLSWSLRISNGGESAPECLRDDGIADFCRVLDAVFDLGDFAYLTTCFTGPGAAQLNTCCEVFDLDGDDDVDLDDVALFTAAINGP